MTLCMVIRITQFGKVSKSKDTQSQLTAEVHWFTKTVNSSVRKGQENSLNVNQSIIRHQIFSSLKDGTLNAYRLNLSTYYLTGHTPPRNHHFLYRNPVLLFHTWISRKV